MFGGMVDGITNKRGLCPEGIIVGMIELDKFLNEYTIIDIPEYNPNFFEIAGFPHYENVFSNVFAFLAEKSGFVIKALLECCNIDFNVNTEKIISASREVLTENNKKIDIVIDTTNIIIGIENKINAPLYNDLEEYYGYLCNGPYEKNKKKLLLVLSKNKIPNIPSKYYGILHYDISVSIKKYYSLLLKELDHRYFVLLNEFIENIDLLHGGNYMNNDFIQIAKHGNNVDKINNIVQFTMETRKEYKKHVKNILSDLEAEKTFPNKWIYGDTETDEVGYLSITAVLQDCFVTKSKYNITFDIVVSLDGYSIILFEREERGNGDFFKLMKEIIPDFDENFDIKGSWATHKIITFDDYDVLIQKMKSFIQCIKDYKKSMKDGV